MISGYMLVIATSNNWTAHPFVQSDSFQNRCFVVDVSTNRIDDWMFDLPLCDRINVVERRLSDIQVLRNHRKVVSSSKSFIELLLELLQAGVTLPVFIGFCLGIPKNQLDCFS